MLKNRSLRLSFDKNPVPGTETLTTNVDPAQIEEIARRSVLDLTKLGVAAIGTLMILHRTLNIVEHKAIHDD